MKWLDYREIAIKLDEMYPELDNQRISYVKFREMIINLDGFDDKPDGCNEKILEAIQSAWFDERS